MTVFAWHACLLAMPPCVLLGTAHVRRDDDASPGSLADHGWHSAAWRVTVWRASPAPRPSGRWRKTAERGGLDAVLLGLPTAPTARRDGGKVDGIRLDPLPLAGGDDRRHRADRPLRLVAGRRRRAVSCRAGLRDPRSSRLGTHRLDHRLEGPEELGTAFSHTNSLTEEDSAARLGRAHRRRAPALGQLGGSRLRRRPGRAGLSPTRLTSIRSIMPEGSLPCAGRSTCRAPCRASR